MNQPEQLIFWIAVGANYLWELAAAPLYTVTKGCLIFPSIWLGCLIASLGDGLMVMSILLAGRLVFHERQWTLDLTILKGSFIVLAGAIMAILVEWLGVHVWGWWSYSASMPQIAGIGWPPMIQMSFLPWLVFKIVSRFMARAS